MDPSGAAPDHAIRLRTEAVRTLLDRNGTVLQLMADLAADLDHLPHHHPRIRRPVLRLLDETLLMAQELNLVTGDRHARLYAVLGRLRAETRAVLREVPVAGDRPVGVDLDDPAALQAELVGDKAAFAALLRPLLPGHVPGGFVLTTAAYHLFLQQTGLAEKARLLLQDVEFATDAGRLSALARTLGEAIVHTPLPGALGEAIARCAGRAGAAPSVRWAVRSSALGEGGLFSFAGQFDTQLQVETAGLAGAYRCVVASRFGERALRYRLRSGVREVDTPMAVLFMPMIDARFAGVVHTADPGAEDRECIVVHAAPGLGVGVVAGAGRPEVFRFSREDDPRLLDGPEAAAEPGVRGGCAGRAGEPASGGRAAGAVPVHVPQSAARLALRIAASAGRDLELEWASDAEDRVWFLQGRPLRCADRSLFREGLRRSEAPALLEAGVTVFPGRAEGPVCRLRTAAEAATVPQGAVVVLEHPRPEFAPALGPAGAVLAEGGDAAGHLATLCREFAVPAVFQMGAACARLAPGQIVSVDATRRRVFVGSRWPGVRERVLARTAERGARRTGPFHELILALHLLDPRSWSFRAASCRSLHDCTRFMHEMAVRSLFRLGDRRPHGGAPKLRTALPLRLKLLDLDGSFPAGPEWIEPGEVRSAPFQAWWRGVSDPRLPWRERWDEEFAHLPRGFRQDVLDGGRGPRGPRAANYAIVSGDYFNLNARMAFHYAMVDALLGPGAHHNHVHFRFFGGGGGREQRDQRTRFLELALRRLGFGVDRHGELLNAWLRGLPRADSETALAALARLMVCARQLDRFDMTEGWIKTLADGFLAENFALFG